MAKAIDFTVHVPTPAEQLPAQVEESAQALSEALLLLRELHNHGVLEVLVKVVRGGEGLSASALHILGGQSGTTILRNASELVKTLEAIDSRELSVLGHALSVGVGEGAKNVAQGKGLGLGDLISLTRDRDIQLALGAVFGVLKGMGRAMREAREETPETAHQQEVGRGTYDHR